MILVRVVVSSILNGDKGGGKGALGEQVSQQIGYAKRHDEGIIGIACAEHEGKYLLSYQTEYSADKNGD
jgi:hypothetical protein